MRNRWDNYGLWISIATAVTTSAGVYISATTQELKIAVIITLITTILGIISNPKEGKGYLDQ